MWPLNQNEFDTAGLNNNKKERRKKSSDGNTTEKVIRMRHGGDG